MKGSEKVRGGLNFLRFLFFDAINNVLYSTNKTDVLSFIIFFTEQFVHIAKSGDFLIIYSYLKQAF